MSSEQGPPLAHRSVASIRSAPSQGQAGPATPSTPPRAIASAYGSPSTIRSEEEPVVIELGSRFVRAGFAGDSIPKAVVQCGQEQRRRVGDFRAWETSVRSPGHAWAADNEIWRYDLRSTDLGLVHDKLDRLLRDIFTRFLLIDSKPRRMSLVLDSELPLPLLSAVLDTLFERFQTLSVSLLSSATVTTVAAGVRSALVVNMGWSQTVVTSVYEYREVQSTQSVRAGRWLLDELYKKVIYPLVTGEDQMDEEKQDGDRVVSFEEAEDILCRLMWCRPSAFRDSQRESAQLETVEEQDETEAETAAHGGQIKGTTRVPLTTSVPPKTIDISFEKLSDVCDDTFFDQSMTAATHDDHDLPVHHLIYRHLLQLPMDVRAICMSRIIFTGGCSNILGLKQRVMDELVSMVDKRGWEPVTGKAVEAFRKNTKLNRKGSSLPSREGTPPASETGDSQSGSPASASETSQEMDPIEAKVQRQRGRTQQMQGQLRALHSLGPWAGASLACLLKQTSMATVDRDLWLQQGIHGASRPNDIDIKAAQRQSMGAGVVRGGAGQANWTLGAWGNT